MIKIDSKKVNHVLSDLNEAEINLLRIKMHIRDSLHTLKREYQLTDQEIMDKLHITSTRTLKRWMNGTHNYTMVDSSRINHLHVTMETLKAKATAPIQTPKNLPPNT